MAGGRPSKDTPAVRAEILQRMAEGESVRKICTEKHLPTWGTLMRWLREDESGEFRLQYAQAREDLIDAWMFDAYNSAHDETRDYQDVVETIDSDKGGFTTKKKRISDNSASMRDRLKVDTILRIAAKMLPKKYGDKLDIQQDMTVRHVIDHTPMNDEEWAKNYAKDGGGMATTERPAKITH